MIHAVEFRTPTTCPQCDGAAPSEEEAATGDLPYIPGLPTPIEDERTFREMARTFLDAAEVQEIATVKVKYAELGLRAFALGAAMGEKRAALWISEKRQAEVRAVPRAKRK